MTKRQLIDEIVAVNQTAEPAFLARFDDTDLNEYLLHLKVLDAPRLNGNPRRFDKYFRSVPTIPVAKVTLANAAKTAATEEERIEPAASAQVQTQEAVPSLAASLAAVQQPTATWELQATQEEDAPATAEQPTAHEELQRTLAETAVASSQAAPAEQIEAKPAAEQSESPETRQPAFPLQPYRPTVRFVLPVAQAQAAEDILPRDSEPATYETDSSDDDVQDTCANPADHGCDDTVEVQAAVLVGASATPVADEPSGRGTADDNKDSWLF